MQQVIVKLFLRKTTIDLLGNFTERIFDNDSVYATIIEPCLDPMKNPGWRCHTRAGQSGEYYKNYMKLTKTALKTYFTFIQKPLSTCFTVVGRTVLTIFSIGRVPAAVA